MVNVYKPNTKKWFLVEIFRYMEVIDCRDDYQYYKNRLMFLTNPTNNDVFMKRMRSSFVYSCADLVDCRSIYVRLLTEYFSFGYHTGRCDFTLPIGRFPLFKIKDIYFALRDCVMHM